MKIRDRKVIDRKVRLFIEAMPPLYENETPRDVVISEILSANDWFVDLPDTMEVIRAEVESRFNFYVER